MLFTCNAYCIFACHTFQFPDGDEEAASGNPELANASVTYFIADPGSGIHYMRSSLGEESQSDKQAADEAYERGQVCVFL